MFFTPKRDPGHRARPLARRRVHKTVPRPLEGLESRDVPAAGPLGLNLTTMAFVDVMKAPTGDWSQVGETPLTRDSHGWPTSDASILAIDDRVNEWWNGPDPNAVQPDLAGTYHLSFHGRATVSTPDWLPEYTVENQSYDPRTNVTTADVVVQQDALAFLQIFFTDTSNPESPTGAGVSDVHLIQPGYDAGTTQTFTNDFLNALKPFTALRYLNVDGANDYGPETNNDGPLDWSQRRLPTDSSQNDFSKVGMSWEYMIALANATNTDMWINVPGTATDDYVAQLAALIKNGDTVDGVSYAGLNPNLKVYLEYSNEVWGGIYNPFASNRDAAQAEVAAGGSALNNDGNSDPDVWANRRYLERTMQVTNIFRDVIGADPSYSKIRPVLGWQEGNWNYFTDTLPWFQATYGAPSQFFYGMGYALYWGASDTSSPDAILDSLAAGEADSAAVMQQFTAVAEFYGMKNISYEGGPSLSGSDDPDAANALAASRDPRMEALVEQHYLDWYAAGGDLTAYYNGPFDIWSPNYGIWSAAELSQVHDPSQSPKYRGLLDLAADSPVAPVVGTAVSATDPTSLPLDGDTLGGSFTTPESGQANYWLINVDTAGNYDLALSTVTSPNDAAATGSVRVLLGDQRVVGTYSVGQGGTFSLGSLPLQAGLNILAIQTVAGVDNPAGTNPNGSEFQPEALTLSPSGTSLVGPEVGDPGFESLGVGGGNFAYDPAGSAWAFNGNAGVSGNDSGFTSDNSAAPQGSQVAFLQGDGSFSESVAGWADGRYTIAFQAAQRSNFGLSVEDFEVLVDGEVVGTFQPSNTDYQSYSTASFTVAAGAHTVTFRGLDSAGGDNTAFLDNVSIASV